MPEANNNALLAGRKVLVTGAARGLGLAFVKSLAEAGAAVAMADILADRLQQEADALRARGFKVVAVPMDLSDPVSVQACADAAIKGLGGLDGLKARAQANAAALDKLVRERDWLGHLAADPATRSTTSVCLTVEGADEAFVKAFAAALEKEGAAYDIAGYRDAPAGLRIWCGATVDAADIEALGPWLDWAYASVKATAA